jgi:ParB-like chromosome segregation protein Spo0J
MRHDAHYVDELLSEKRARQVILIATKDITVTVDEGWKVEPLADSLAEFGVLQPLLVRRNRGRYELVAGAKRLAAAKAAGFTDVPCMLYDVDDDQAQRIREATNLGRGGTTDAATDNTALLRAVFPILGQSLQTIRSSLQLLRDSTAGSRDRVANDLIRTEAQRATRLAWAATLISHAPALNLTEFDAADVLEEVLGACAEERALAGLKLDKRIQSRCEVKADRMLIAAAVRGTVDTILPLARSRQAATLAVSLARHQPSRSIVLQVSQDALRPDDSVWNRWFDLRWRDRPGGFASSVGLLAAKRVIELHGGRLAIAPTNGPGCRIALSCPDGRVPAP